MKVDASGIAEDPNAYVLSKDGFTVLQRVVIATHEVHRQPLVDELRQLRQHPHVGAQDEATRRNPDIEEVTIDDESGRALSGVAEEGPEGAFRIRGHGAKVDVRDDEEWSAGTHGRISALIPGARLDRKRSTASR